MRVRTPCVIWGRVTVMVGAVGVYLASAGGLLGLFVASNISRSRWTFTLIAVAGLLYAKVVVDLVRLWARARRVENAVDKSARKRLILELRGAVTVPTWLMSSGVAALALALAALLWSER